MKYGESKYNTCKYGIYRIKNITTKSNFTQKKYIRLKAGAKTINCLQIDINKKVNIVKIKNTICMPLIINKKASIIRIKDKNGNTIALCSCITK